MDFISVIGLVGFISAIIYGLEGQWDIFWTGEGISIVVAGSFGAVMLRSTAGEFFNMFPTMLKIFRHKIDKPVDLIDQMVELATIARKDGMIALENQEVSNRFLQKGVRALVDGNDAAFIRSSLQRDTAITAQRHESAKSVLVVGRHCPCYGYDRHLNRISKIVKEFRRRPRRYWRRYVHCALNYFLWRSNGKWDFFTYGSKA